MESESNLPEEKRSDTTGRSQVLPTEDPPVVLPPVFRSQLEPTSSVPCDDNDNNFLEDVELWLENLLGKESYGAPRVFDLFTMLAITLAFALLFAFLRLIEPLLLGDMAATAIVMGVFVTGVALFQLALWGGKKPRMSSLVAGPPLIIVIVIGICLTSRAGLTFSDILAALCMSVFGVPAGYLGGAMVAGVFLIADVIRNRFLESDKPVEENDDAIFKE